VKYTLYEPNLIEHKIRNYKGVKYSIYERIKYVCDQFEDTKDEEMDLWEDVDEKEDLDEKDDVDMKEDVEEMENVLKHNKITHDGDQFEETNDEKIDTWEDVDEKKDVLKHKKINMVLINTIWVLVGHMNRPTKENKL